MPSSEMKTMSSSAGSSSGHRLLVCVACTCALLFSACPLERIAVSAFQQQQQKQIGRARVTQSHHHQQPQQPIVANRKKRGTTLAQRIPLASTASSAAADDNSAKKVANKSQRRIVLPTVTSDGTIAKTCAATAATVVTYIVNNQYNLGPVMGSSLVALASAIVLGPSRPVLQLAALCGSFAGMARQAVTPTPAAAVVLGLVCSYMIRLFDRQKWLIGKGGRLGFIAQVACTSTFVALRFGSRVIPSSIRSLLVPVLGEVVAPAALVDLSLYRSLSVSGICATLPPMILSTIAGAFSMLYFKEYASKLSLPRLATPTAAVGATGAIAALVSPAVAGPAFIGSFVAMSAPTVLANRKALAAASALSAVGWIGMTGLLLGGWGGKMGTAALLGVIMYGSLGDTKGKE